LIKRIVLLTAVLILSLSAPAVAAEPGSGTINGQVVNQTEGGSSVADQEITLNIFLNDEETDSLVTSTDAEGYFVFNNLSTTPDYGYEAKLEFQEADYYSNWISFNDSQSSEFAEVIVYDSTTSEDALKVAMAHTIIYVERGRLRVNEYYLFLNDTDRTYIGSKLISGDDTKETLRFTLPVEAIEVETGQGLMNCCIFSSEDGFVDSMPVMPGNREVAYSYFIDYDSDKYSFVTNLNYPTTRYDLLYQGTDVKAVTEQLTPDEPLNIREILFSHLLGVDLAPTDTLVTGFSNLPKVDNIQQTILWVVITMGVLGGSIGYFYYARNKKLQPVKIEDSTENTREKLLMELARLDDDYQSGKIGEEDYRKLRTTKKSQLVKVIQSPGERRGNS